MASEFICSGARKLLISNDRVKIGVRIWEWKCCQMGLLWARDDLGSSSLALASRILNHCNIWHTGSQTWRELQLCLGTPWVRDTAVAAFQPDTSWKDLRQRSMALYNIYMALYNKYTGDLWCLALDSALHIYKQWINFTSLWSFTKLKIWASHALSVFIANVVNRWFWDMTH